MERLDLFATPVVVVDVPGMEPLNRELVERLLEEETRTPGVQRSNHGGWHSEPDLMKRAQPCFQALMQSILEQVGNAVAVLTPRTWRPGKVHLHMLHAWAMIMREGDYAVEHDHGDATWSTAYYVDGGDSDGSSGGLGFTDPRRGVRSFPELDLFPPAFTFQPRTSALVVFPGWLKHQVYSYNGKRPRISISTNIVMTVPSPAPEFETA